MTWTMVPMSRIKNGGGRGGILRRLVSYCLTTLPRIYFVKMYVLCKNIFSSGWSVTFELNVFREGMICKFSNTK